MSSERRTPHVVRKERPAKPTTQIAQPALDKLVDSLREAPPPDPTAEPAFELPDAVEEDVIELDMNDDETPPPTTTVRRVAHTVRRPKP